MKRCVLAFAVGLVLPPCCGAETVDFVDQIYPIFANHCTKCHGETKQAGELSLHLPSTIEEFGVVTGGEPDNSTLYERITLDADDEMRMPKGSAPLSEAEVELIRTWIEEGAMMPEDEVIIEITQAPSIDLPEAEPATEEAIAAVQETGAAVIELYAGSPLLQVSFAHASSPATDVDLDALAGVAKQVVALNLARSAVTNDGLAKLEPLQNLMRLHLENTSISDAGLGHLAGLTRLEYLNLYGTKVTDEGLKHLEGLDALERLYLWQTDVSYDAAMALQNQIEGLEVNLGWDHPEVVKAREARLAELAAARGEAEAQTEETANEEAAEGDSDEGDNPAEEAEAADEGDG